LDGLKRVCSSPPGKELVQQKIEQLRCVYGGPGKRSINVNDKTLDWTIDWTAANNADYYDGMKDGHGGKQRIG
jgi:hypothetical protein